MRQPSYNGQGSFDPWPETWLFFSRSSLNFKVPLVPTLSARFPSCIAHISFQVGQLSVQ